MFLPIDIRADVPDDAERQCRPRYPDRGQKCVEESVDELQDILVHLIVVCVDHEFVDPVVTEDDGEYALPDGGAGYVEHPVRADEAPSVLPSSEPVSPGEVPHVVLRELSPVDDVPVVRHGSEVQGIHGHRYGIEGHDVPAAFRISGDMTYRGTERQFLEDVHTEFPVARFVALGYPAIRPDPGVHDLGEDAIGVAGDVSESDAIHIDRYGPAVVPVGWFPEELQVLTSFQGPDDITGPFGVSGTDHTCADDVGCDAAVGRGPPERDAESSAFGLRLILCDRSVEEPAFCGVVERDGFGHDVGHWL